MKATIVLTSTALYHSAPINGRPHIMTNDGNVIPSVSGIDGSPITRTYAEPIVTSKTESESVYLPVIRSLQLTKALRNLFLERVFETLEEKQKTLSPGAYNGLSVGAATGKPAQEDAQLTDRKAAFETPVALFGGGSKSMKSLLTIGSAYPVLRELIEDAIVPTIADKHALEMPLEDAQRKLRHAVAFTRRDPLLSMTVERIGDVTILEGGAQTIADIQSAVNASTAARKANAELKKYDLTNIAALEYVPAGTPFAFDISIPDGAGKAAQGAVAVILEDMQERSGNLLIGGRSTRGAGGKFKVDIYVDGKPFNADQYKTEIDAYSDWLGSLDTKSVEEFYAK